jgi:predicted RNase H-like HicB family nuclease
MSYTEGNSLPLQDYTDCIVLDNQEYRREKFMKINIVYKEEKGWFVGHIQEYPDYESQGKTLEELRDNLIEIYDDIRKGLVPDAEPFQILEVAI